MGRANAIVVGSAVLAPLILGVEGYTIFRSHHRPRAAEMADFPSAAAPDPPANTAVRIGPPAPTPAAPEPRVPPAPVVAPEPVETPVGSVVQQRQRSLMQHQRQMVRDADEQVFEVLGLPDAQRAAIRAIDDQYVAALRSMELVPSGSDPGNAGVDLGANRTRREAIANVLGAEGMRAFNVAEQRAERTLRGQVRPQLVRGH